MEPKAWVKIKSPSPLCSRSLRAALKDCVIVTLNTRNNGTEFILELESNEQAKDSDQAKLWNCPPLATSSSYRKLTFPRSPRAL